MQCEMCGAETPRTRRFLVERTPLRVCVACEKFGTPLEGASGRGVVVPGNVPMAMEKRKRAQGQRDVFSTNEMQLEMVEDFAQRIKTAREKKGWTRQDLGGRVGEREVVIGRMENGTLHPPDEVAKKLERELGIKLFAPVQTGTTANRPQRSLTLGDMLSDALKKKRDE